MTPAAALAAAPVPLDVGLSASGFTEPGLPMVAHEPVGPSELWSSWHPDPLVVAGLALLAVAYRHGLRSFWQRSARHRIRSAARSGDAHRRLAGAGQVGVFVGGVLALAVALASPLDGVAAALFSAHMVQHLLLIVVAAPLLVAGRTGRVVTGALPRRARRRVWRIAGLRPIRRAAAVVWHPLVVWGLGTIVLWVWHLPSPYEAALSNDALHAIEHLTLLATALLLWTVVLGRGHRRAGVPLAVLLLFGTALQGAALGAVLVFAQAPLYPIHETTARLWDLTPLADQQLAGGLMWVPSGLVYLGVTAHLVVRWFNALDQTDAPSTQQPPDTQRTLVGSSMEGRP